MYPSSVECISDMKPFQILMMSVNRTALTRASIIINMYERIDKGQTVGFHKNMMRLHYLVSSPDNDENIHFFMIPLPQNLIKWIIIIM